MLIASDFTVTSDPSWPWSLPGMGMPALIGAAAVLAGVTVWTYFGVPEASWRRVGAVLALRLFALLLACLAALRPALAFYDEWRQPSMLLVALDTSESMTIRDEIGSESRWNHLRNTLRDCEPILQQLHDQHNVNVLFYRFSSAIQEFDLHDDAVQPNGKRSDYGAMLQDLYERHRSERSLRGLIVCGDGAHNGTGQQPLPLAARWRTLPCPVHTVGCGKTTTSDRQRDVALTGIHVEPVPVRTKGSMTIKSIVDAPGFENRKVRLRLFIDDQEVATQDEILRQTTGNSVQITCNAPPKPGEVKVTLKIDPQVGEMTTLNNEIVTYTTVAGDGISVLLVDKLREESKFVREAFREDPRIRVFQVILGDAGKTTPNQLDLFQFEKQHYNVIILGDITPRQLQSGNPDVFNVIKKLVHDKGAGLLMTGGFHSFGSAWDGTPLAELLPVGLDGTAIDQPVKMVPTEPGLRHFVMRLADNQAENARIWKGLHELSGMSLLGKLKKLSVVLAQSQDQQPILVAQTFGDGRTLAFAGDTTWQWIRPPHGAQYFARFWRQLVFWLAKQDEATGNAWVRLDTHRLSAGSKLGFRVGLRGQGGVDVKDARYNVKVIGPHHVETPVPTARENEQERGSFWKTSEAGEYKVVVQAEGRDTEGREVSPGTASARFLVYQDDAEMTQRAADHDFLKKLAATGGGRFHSTQELARFLHELAKQPSAQSRPKASLWPKWRRSDMSAFLGVYFMLFTAVLSLEWFLRRRWGLV